MFLDDAHFNHRLFDILSKVTAPYGLKLNCQKMLPLQTLTQLLLFSGHFFSPTSEATHAT